MPVEVLLNAFAYIDSHDFTGDSNTSTLTATAQVHPITNFRSGGWTENAMGIFEIDYNLAGFGSFGADSVDSNGFDNLGVTDKTHIVGPSETDEGGVCKFWQGGSVHFEQFGVDPGNVNPFSVNSVGTDGQIGLVMGRLIKAMGTVSATGATGGEVQLGAVASDEYLYGSFHVFGTPGTTITGVLESDADDTFGSATTRITFGPYTTAGGRFATRVAGPITDTWYRLRVTAVTGSFVIACAAGIQ
jgi:hypothetical protein